MKADDAHDMLMVLRDIHRALTQQVTALHDLGRSVDGLRAVVAERLNPEPPEAQVFPPDASG